MTQAQSSAVTSQLHETRLFPPPAAFAEQANVKSAEAYEQLYRRSIDDPEGFWGEIAERFHWFKKWDKVCEFKAPDAKWFVGGKTNICYNCIDRQIDAGLGEQTAIIWEGEPMPGGKPEVRNISYNELLSEVSRFANVLKKLGVKKGDVVTLYMPMVPELAIAMLACARIGAPHSIIFGGFSASAIKDRVEDGQSSIIITADGGWRRGKAVPLKDNVDEALTMTDRVKTVVTLKRCGNDINMTAGRDHWWHDLTQGVSDQCDAEPMDSEDLLFILYTSGSTGKPKGIMHTTGGYMVYTYFTSQMTFDLKGDIATEPTSHQANKPAGGAASELGGLVAGGSVASDVYWCTADIGWITGHSYIIYGILPNRVPTLMYEGAPDAPDKDRFWDIIERHKVTHFYTAPTAIRAFMKWGEDIPAKHDLSTLRLLGTVVNRTPDREPDDDEEE